MSFACPCCKNLTLSEEPPGTYEICPVCGWEDDHVQFHDVEYEGGANSVSLAKARQNYEEFGACCDELRSDVRPPTADEVPN